MAGLSGKRLRERLLPGLRPAYPEPDNRRAGLHATLAARTLTRHRRANGQTPYWVRGFKAAHHPVVAEKLEAIVGREMFPAEHPQVPCCDEKSQVLVS